jgi:hypothetical protein
MVTETDIITMLSGSLLGDYPAVMTSQTARKNAVEIFRKIFDIDVNGGINSVLFYQKLGINPEALHTSQTTKIQTALLKLDNLTKDILPKQVQKLPFIVDAETLQVTPTGVIVTEQIRQALIAERQRLGELFKMTANVPTILSTMLVN